ncbi:c-type cytochrome biogenesis protein CcmI [Arenicella chitinivorans]|uniref:C-type cytochrome biogenesis protein CcmI n=1 Tax=Arenicella chitinivorans TaxID=1329800 RepID=A0A918RL24_9GAMM|nr:c-type cytochrome biogenesis protein CcmI [Arenicella chitinivorans]GHA02331.1 c-type cytochrome biogenesis protein CcmI [Arenicella chitinivorans]
MTAFILTAIGITLAALLLAFMPLLRPRRSISYQRQAQNIHFARERIAELEEQLKNASISATDYEALKLEIETTLANDIDIDNASQEDDLPSQTGSNRGLIALLSVSIPLAAFAVYMLIGTPDATQQTAQFERPEQAEIDALIEGIEQRLQESPDDLEGWTLISRTYLSLGRYREAHDAYLRVLALGGEQASTYAALADATALMSNGEITPEAARYVERALELDADNQQALWLAGVASLQQGNQSQARVYWQKLLQRLDGMPEQQQELRDIMAQSLGTQESVTADVVTDNGPALTLRVSLDASLADSVSPNDLVFVIARAQNGPPAPLAVKRLRVSDLPLELTLSDADAMLEQLKLSKFANVVVRARISKSGQPIASSGDLQSGEQAVQTTHAERIDLTISELVE